MTNEQIESVARRICEELGLNPDQYVSTTTDGIMTSQEIFLHYGSKGYGVYDTNVQRWQTYRNQAALAIASYRAVVALST